MIGAQNDPLPQVIYVDGDTLWLDTWRQDRRKVGSLAKDIEELQKACRSIQARCKGLDTKIEDLQETCRVHEARVENLQERFRLHEARIEELQVSLLYWMISMFKSLIGRGHREEEPAKRTASTASSHPLQRRIYVGRGL